MYRMRRIELEEAEGGYQAEKKREQRPVGVKALKQKERRSCSFRKRDKAESQVTQALGTMAKLLAVIKGV